jgi:hypothetical protein
MIHIFKDTLKRTMTDCITESFEVLSITFCLTGTKQLLEMGTLVLPAQRNHSHAQSVGSHSCVAVT